MKVTERDGIVVIKDIKLEGFIDKDQICSKCGSHIVYYDDFDTYFCALCNEWKEEKCDDPTCLFCPVRPEKPLPL